MESIDLRDYFVLKNKNKYYIAYDGNIKYDEHDDIDFEETPMEDWEWIAVESDAKTDYDLMIDFLKNGDEPSSSDTKYILSVIDDYNFFQFATTYKQCRKEVEQAIKDVDPSLWKIYNM